MIAKGMTQALKKPNDKYRIVHDYRQLNAIPPQTEPIYNGRPYIDGICKVTRIETESGIQKKKIHPPNDIPPVHDIFTFKTEAFFMLGYIKF